MTPVKNTCTPANIYGGFNQTLFLGCSVVSFALTGGWNEQKGEVTIQLIEDTCSASKTYYDRSLEPQTYVGADPGFIGEDTPIIGAPAYFRVGDFEFSGIISDWVKADIRTLQAGLPVKSNGSAANIYTVKLEDPREILSAAQIIVNEYAGFTSGFDNIVNAYGFLEAIAANCPSVTQGVDGTIFGSPAEGFGGADVDENGMPWANILAGTRTLLSGSTTVGALGGVFSNGYLSFKGVSNTGYTGVSGLTSGMGLIDQNASYEAHYIVDLIDLPAVPASVRMNGTSFPLLDLISQVCEIAGYDYYIELLPVSGTGSWSNPVADSQSIVKVIKVRTVSRDAQPLFGAIEEFINISDDDGIGSINNDNGRELRNEITQQLVIGGPKQNVFDTDTVTFDDPEGDGDPANPEADDMIVPHFGIDTDGNAIIPQLDADGYWYFEADVRSLNFHLAEMGHDLGIDYVTITELELLAALSSKEAWFAYSQDAHTDINEAFGDFGTMINMDLTRVIAGVQSAAPRDRFKSGADINLPTDDLGRNKLNAGQAVFDFVSQIATEYYGSQFQIRVPSSCAYIPTSQDATFVGWGGSIQTSEEPSDGGWTERSTVLGLTNPSVTTDFFRLEDGRIQNILRFAELNNLSVVDLDTSTYIGNTSTAELWVKADAQPEYVFMNKANRTSPRIVVTIPSPIEWKTNDKAGKITGLAKILAILDGDLVDSDKVDAIHKITGGATLNMPFEERKRMPNGAAVCVKSNALKYGPWGSATVAGKANIRNEEGLVPWAYGSYANMNTAGNALASEGVTYMQVGERGSIVVPGYPTLPLGAELLAASASNSYSTAGPYDGGGTNLFANRSIVVTGTGNGQYVGTTMPLWTGQFGPNITGITCQVSAQGINTTYTMRTYTPKFGRFAHTNAERLKQVGQNNMKYAKAARANKLQQFKNNRGTSRNKYLRGLQKNSSAAAGQEVITHTPHEFLVGQLITWNSGEFKRAIIADSPMIEFGSEAPNWGEKAFMSWDGFMMPVSLSGDGGLPAMSIAASGGCQHTHPKASMPPIDKLGEEGSSLQYNLDINAVYLNPFSNPAGFAYSELTTGRSDTPNIGHCIDIIGRGTGIPASSIVMPIQGLVDNSGNESISDYANDYRPMALRGPLLMTGWGYDLNGFPVPNKGTEGVKQNKFADDWLRKPETWPVGPVDLRWDADRAVWVSPPAYRFVVGQMEQDTSAYGTGLASLITGETLYDTEGSPIASPVFVAKDVVGKTMSAGDRVLAAYDTVTCEYHVLNGGIPRVVNTGDCKNSSYWEAASGGAVNVLTGNVSLGKLGIGDGLVLLENTSGGLPQLRTSSLIGYNSVVAVTGDCIEYGSLQHDMQNVSFGAGLIGTAVTGTGSCSEVSISLGLGIRAPDPLDGCVMWEGTGSMPNQADNFIGFSEIYMRNGLTATTGQLFCDDVPGGTGLYLGIDIEVSGRTSALAEKHWHGSRGFTFGDGLTVADTGCLAPIGLFYGASSGSQVVITGVTCSGSSLIVGSGELVWQYGQISGIRSI